MNSLLCLFNEHKFYHIANFSDVTGGRALYQCSRCKKVDIDAPSHFHDKQRRKGRLTRINWHQPKPSK